MRYVVVALLSVLLALDAQAATLLWDAQSAGGSLTVERGESPNGPFTTVATLPSGTTKFILTPGAWGHYRIRNNVGVSNTAQYAADLYSGFLTDRMDQAEARLDTLAAQVSTLQAVPPSVPAPTPITNLTTRTIDTDHIEITGLNCVSLRTTGTGLRRIVECVR